jgi:hypothetical protein
VAKAAAPLLLALLVAAGCSGRSAAIRVVVKVSWAPPAHLRAESFTLRCGPPGGTLPDARRVCRDIAAHPRAMLAPPPARSTCGGRVLGPNLTVTVQRAGTTRELGGQPFCEWPGGTALGVYWAAGRRQSRLLRLAEARLRCDEDRRLLARPTPWASVFACTHGFWTAHDERLIRTAEGVPALRALDPRRLFPPEVGVEPCRIAVGGPSMRVILGKCGVAVRNAWSRPTVTFVEALGPSAAAGGRSFRHRWVVRIASGRPLLVAQSRNVVPQLRR